jgi:E3 ubiquitin-protein ligase RNF1/2
MSQVEKTKSTDQESEDEELSENEERNLENILVLFPYRTASEAKDQVDDVTFDKVKNLLKCPVCLEIYREPVYIKECMHRFCKTCIERIIRGLNHCELI